MEESILERAVIFAAHAHSGMVRKGTKTPYILHPMETAAIVGTMTDNEDILAAAVLHDVLEDTPVSARQLCLEFGEYIAGLVGADTEDKRKDRPASETWKLRKQETIDALQKEKRIEIKMIILGDKLSNIRSIFRDYKVLGDNLWDRFNQKDKKQHGWYYRAIAEATSELSSYPAWQEYNQLVRRVFGNMDSSDD